MADDTRNTLNILADTLPHLHFPFLFLLKNGHPFTNSLAPSVAHFSDLHLWCDFCPDFVFLHPRNNHGGIG